MPISIMSRASYLPGEDAAFVYDLTSYYIFEAGDAAPKGEGRRSRQDKGEAGPNAFLISPRPDCEKP